MGEKKPNLFLGRLFSRDWTLSETAGVIQANEDPFL